jgi:hypothetical protein
MPVIPATQGVETEGLQIQGQQPQMWDLVAKTKQNKKMAGSVSLPKPWVHTDNFRYT